MSFFLSPRLAAAASLILPGSVTDVGTDHGFLPVWLALQDGRFAITATDVREGPLASAKATAHQYGVEGRIVFRLCDGLTDCPPSDNVVIAGMGGETMLHILQTAPWPLEPCALVLQPQSKQELLYPALLGRGFYAQEARLVLDEGRYYVASRFVHDGKARTASPGEAFFPPPLLQQRDRLAAPYLQSLIDRFSRALAGMEAGKSVDKDELARTRALVEDLQRIKKEAERW